MIGQKDEKQTIDLLLSSNNSSKQEKLKNDLITYYDNNYRDEIMRIIQSKYVLKTEDKREASHDLYGNATEIFINKINSDVEILRDFNFRAYILGIARNLFLEKTRKNKEVFVESTPEYATALDEELREGSPFESEHVQKKIEEELINYYIDNDLHDCLKILYYSWKKGLKNQEIAAMFHVENPASKDASRRVTVIQQNCMKKAWRNVPLLEEIKQKYNIKRRKRHEWKKSHD